jgi:aryl-alcohol dehydrogenase-like predicted oxidoreductase
MRSLDSLVRERRVLYLGISNTPAWIVTKANECEYNQRMTQVL